MSISSREFSSFLLLLYWNSRVCLATVRNCSSLKPLCIRQTSVQNDLWASWNALYSPFVKGYKKYFSLYGIALFFYLVGLDPPSSTLHGSQFYSFYSIPPFSHLGGSDSEMLPKPAVSKIVFVYIYLSFTHQWFWLDNSLNISESLDIKLKPGGDPALIPLGEIRVNKPLEFRSWK